MTHVERVRLERRRLVLEAVERWLEYRIGFVGTAFSMMARSEQAEFASERQFSRMFMDLVEVYRASERREVKG